MGGGERRARWQEDIYSLSYALLEISIAALERPPPAASTSPSTGTNPGPGRTGPNGLIKTWLDRVATLESDRPSPARPGSDFTPGPVSVPVGAASRPAAARVGLSTDQASLKRLIEVSLSLSRSRSLSLSALNCRRIKTGHVVFVGGGEG